MPVVVHATSKDSTSDVIKKFKKASAFANTVQIAKDRRYFVKPSKERSIKKIQMKRLRKRLHSLKRMKNISPTVISRLTDRLGK